MLWAVLGGVALLLLFIVWLAKGGGKIRAEHQARFEAGIPATAVIEQVEHAWAEARVRDILA